MSQYINKVLVSLIIALTLLGVIRVVAFGVDYSTTYQWGFPNYSYFGFNRAINFSVAPSQGVSYDPNLVGYWNLDQNSGSVAYDSSSNRNNGTLVNSPTWVSGKYGTALSFSGNGDYVNIPNSFNSTGELTVAFWAKFISGNVPAVEKANSYSLYWDGSSQVLGRVYPNSAFGASGLKADNNWHQIVYTFATNNQQVLYIDGVYLKNGITGNITISNSSSALRLGYVYGSSRTGTVDDVRVYDRALNAPEVAALYAQPDPTYLDSYYKYQDSVTGNTMLIYVDTPNGNSNNSALVTCTDFFGDSKLVFQANNSVIVNIWTNSRATFIYSRWNLEQRKLYYNYNS